jgi:hypothetical protein
MRHRPPAVAATGEPLPLVLELGDARGLRAVRLHHRPLDQRVPFRTIEAAPAARTGFTVPGADVRPGFDLMYHFEVLREDGGGWFEPDPRDATPYHVVPVR